jgi:hypothetical protein
LSPAIRGFALSTIAAALLATISLAVICVVGGADGCTIGFDPETFQNLLAAFGLFAAFAAASLATVGLPLTLILSRLGAERPWSYPLFGFLVGFAVAFVFVTPGKVREINAFLLFSMILFGGLSGTIGGVVWWQSYRRKAVDA